MRLPGLNGPGVWEWLLIGTLGLIFVGPERLPWVARWLGRAYGRFRQLVRLRAPGVAPLEPPEPLAWWEIPLALALAAGIVTCAVLLARR